ncbi:MAG: PqiC family protein [Stellaceae bacterium]
MTGGRAIVLLAAALLAGCGSSPKTHYYTLDPVSGLGNGKLAIATPVTVAAVHLPASLDRREMIRQTGQNAVDISEQDRWEAPLGGLTRRVLTQDLAAYLPEDMVILPDSPAPPRTAQIVVSITQFAPDAAGEVTLGGSWALLEGGSGKLIMSRAVRFESPATARDASSQASAMSALLGRLAEQIAGGLQKAK